MYIIMVFILGMLIGGLVIAPVCRAPAQEAAKIEKSQKDIAAEKKLRKKIMTPRGKPVIEDKTGLVKPGETIGEVSTQTEREGPSGDKED